MKWVFNQHLKKRNKRIQHPLTMAKAKKIREYHKRFQQYEMTPLWRLSNLATFLGISELFIKDESYRFGLNAFKVLGGTYAIGKYLAKRLKLDISEVTFDLLQSKEVKKQLGEITFISATDGNHGRGVAWAAQQLGQHAKIYLPKGSAQSRVEHIRATGAEVFVTNVNYDETVKICAKLAEENGWVMVQDTSWEGYTDIPKWIMQGYATMAVEVIEQMNTLKVEQPTHIILQAGVGSFAASIQGLFSSIYGENGPMTIIVEPEVAECFYLSAHNRSGEAKIVTGELHTIMAGLACGEPNPVAWELLKAYSKAFISAPEFVAAQGMRILGNPLATDSRIIAGESGALPLGVLSEIMRNDYYQQLREQLQLNEDSKVLLFNTEGDTDEINYRQIVWDGKYPSPK